MMSVFSPAFGDVVYLHAERNSSIKFSCVFPAQRDKPFALSLTREWLRKGVQVLYHNFNAKPEVKDIMFKDRISDQTDMNQRNVNVSITHLQGYDTDVYVCMFHYNRPTGFQNLSGRDKFVLYVKDYCKYNILISPQGQAKMSVAKKNCRAFQPN